jgi:transcriptional regulator GlxA family with amidase domain
MKIAFIIFNGMTTLDFVGAHDAVTRLKTMRYIEDLRWDICSFTDEVKDLTGLQIVPAKVRQSLGDYDVVIVPGGYATRELVKDEAFIAWIKTAAPCELKTSVCTGSVLLGAAGFLQDKRATTHQTSFKALEPFCAKVVDEKVVDEGDVITARGVTSSIDLGLHLCERLAGKDVREQIRKQMDYQV